MSRTPSPDSRVHGGLRAEPEANKYHDMYDRAFTFVGLLDTEGCVLDANRTALEFAGVSLVDVLGRNFCETPWWQACASSREKLKNAIERGRKGQFSRFEAVHTNTRGERIVVDFTLAPVLDVDGKVAELQVEGRDITALERTMDALRQSEARFRQLAAMASDWYWEQDENFRFVNFSETVQELAGSSRASHIGKTRWELPHVGVSEEQWAEHRALLERHEPFRHFEYRRVNEQGQTIWMSASGDPIFDAEGRFRGYRGTGTNITERKRVEEALRNKEAELCEAQRVAHAGSWHWDAETDITTGSDELLRIYGLDPATQEMPKFKEQRGLCYPVEDWERVNAAIQGARKTGVSHELEVRAFRNGSPIWIAIRSEVIRSADGSVIGVRGTVQDITERRRSADALAQLNQELEVRVSERTRELEREMKLREEAQAALAHSQRMEALGQLTGGIAHDFNNLLTVVSGNLELAEAQLSDEKARRSIRQAIQAVEMGASLNRRLLSFARRRKLTPQRLILNDRVSEMQKLLQRTLGEEVTLQTRIEPELWSTLVDPGEIDSAIINIAINARDAMSGGGILTVATRNVALDDAAARQAEVGPGDYVCLSLADTGRGMTPEVLHRAVEPFFTTKEAGKGTGLGLSSVYGFARQSGGFLGIASEIGKGTTVSLYLPRAVSATASTRSAATTTEVPMGDGELILVVEDNDQVRQVTLDRLESLGYDVLEARSGEEAIDLLEGGAPVALVFSDVVMPGGTSGYDIARWIRDAKPALEVLLTSGNEEPARREAGDLSGLRVLGKPYTRAQLGRAIHEALRTEHFRPDGRHP